MRFGDHDSVRTLMDALPVYVFLMDDDARVHDANAAARAAFGADNGEFRMRSGGDVLHCLHAHDVPEGCGKGPVCEQCRVRDCVRRALSGEPVVRQRARMTLVQADKKQDLVLLLTARRYLARTEPLCILVIEDVTEVAMLQEIIPICAHCKKVREDKGYWRSVESYFAAHSCAEFSHGICPACLEKFYPDLDAGGQDA
jgi:PAS domain-containing protein